MRKRFIDDLAGRLGLDARIRAARIRRCLASPDGRNRRLPVNIDPLQHDLDTTRSAHAARARC